MGGTVRGSIEHFFPSVGVSCCQDAFVAIVKFLRAHPNWTGVASQGNGAGAPATWTYSSGVNPPGQNAFAVFRKGGANSYNLLVQWTGAAALGTAPGNPCFPTGTYMVAMAMAYDTSGGTSVWNGTTVNNGTDTKGATVWKASGGNLIVHPRANGLNGSYVVNKQACQQVFYSALNNRFQILADDDFLFVAQDGGNDALYDYANYFGPYTPASGVTPVGAALVAVGGSGYIQPQINIGNPAGNGVEGGVADYSGANQSRTLKLSLDVTKFTTNLQPNGQRSPVSYDVYDIPIVLDDVNTVTTRGLIGYIDLVKAVYGVNTHDADVALTKVFIGRYPTTQYTWVVPWDGVTLPGSGATVAGVQF